MAEVSGRSGRSIAEVSEVAGKWPKLVAPLACRAFRQAGLGPLVGKRSWGGVVGIYPSRTPLIDGGRTMVPEAGSAGADGEWVIEGHGVEPDVVVENDPSAVLAGRDPQLEKAALLLLEKLETDPRPLFERPAAPVKTE